MFSISEKIQKELKSDVINASTQPLKMDTQKQDSWFDLPTPKITSEVKQNLLFLKMKNTLDPKRHFSVSKTLPTKFHFGTVVDGPADFYNRIPRKQRGQDFVDELLNDHEKRKYLKKKFMKVQTKKQSGGKKYYNSKKKPWQK